MPSSFERVYEANGILQPENRSEHVWRYIDLAKLVYILEHNRLPLPRLDTLEDPLEGRFPKAALDNLCQNLGDRISDVALDIERQSRSFFVSCWCLQSEENALLWRIFSNTYGVAIKTTYEKIAENAEKQHCLTGQIQYIDHNEHTPPPTSPYKLAFLKASQYKDEREVRIINSVASHMATLEGNSPHHAEINFEVSQCIENIIISPFAPKWFHDTASALLAKYNTRHLLADSALRATD